MSLGSHAFQTCICSLIVVNSFFVLYLMCCFGNNPLYMDFTPMKIMFCSVSQHCRPLSPSNDGNSMGCNTLNTKQRNC